MKRHLKILKRVRNHLKYSEINKISEDSETSTKPSEESEMNEKSSEEPQTNEKPSRESDISEKII